MEDNISIVIKNNSSKPIDDIVLLVSRMETALRQDSSLKTLINMYKIKYNLHFKVILFDDMRIYKVNEYEEEDFDKLMDKLAKIKFCNKERTK